MIKIDKHGFSSLLHKNFWQNTQAKKSTLTEEVEEYTQALYLYLKRKNIRVEILKAYNKYIDFDAKYFIENGYDKYILESLDFYTHGLTLADKILYTENIYTLDLQIENLLNSRYAHILEINKLSSLIDEKHKIIQINQEYKHSLDTTGFMHYGEVDGYDEDDRIEMYKILKTAPIIFTQMEELNSWIENQQIPF